MSPEAQPAALAADRLHEIRLDRRAAAICDEGGDADSDDGGSGSSHVYGPAIRHGVSRVASYRHRLKRTELGLGSPTVHCWKLDSHACWSPARPPSLHHSDPPGSARRLVSVAYDETNSAQTSGGEGGGAYGMGNSNRTLIMHHHNVLYSSAGGKQNKRFVTPHGSTVFGPAYARKPGSRTEPGGAVWRKSGVGPLFQRRDGGRRRRHVDRSLPPWPRSTQTSAK